MSKQIFPQWVRLAALLAYLAVAPGKRALPLYPVNSPGDDDAIIGHWIGDEPAGDIDVTRLSAVGYGTIASVADTSHVTMNGGHSLRVDEMCRVVDTSTGAERDDVVIDDVTGNVITLASGVTGISATDQIYMVPDMGLSIGDSTRDITLAAGCLLDIDGTGIALDGEAKVDLGGVVVEMTSGTVPGVVCCISHGMAFAADEAPTGNAASIGGEADATTGYTGTGVTLTSEAGTRGSSYMLKAVAADGTSDRINRTQTTVVGLPYRVSFDVWCDGVSGRAYGWNTTFSQNTGAAAFTESWQRQEVLVVATSTSTVLRWYAALAGSAGDILYLDNVEIRRAFV